MFLFFSVFSSSLCVYLYIRSEWARKELESKFQKLMKERNEWYGIFLSIFFIFFQIMLVFRPAAVDFYYTNVAL